MSRNDETTLAAVALIAAIEKALAEGVKHMHPKTKKPLLTVKEVLDCLHEEGEFLIDTGDQSEEEIARGIQRRIER